MKTATTIILFVFICCVLFSCKKSRSGGECEEPIDIRYNSSIGVIFKDKATNKYLYSTFNPLYNKDSIMISPIPGDTLTLIRGVVNDSATNEGFWAINFGNLYDFETDESSFATELCKDFLVKYSYSETDTIKVCFKSELTKCGAIFKTLKVYNKGVLLSSQMNEPYATITVIKN